MMHVLPRLATQAAEFVLEPIESGQFGNLLLRKGLCVILLGNSPEHERRAKPHAKAKEQNQRRYAKKQNFVIEAPPQNRFVDVV
ncbi:MAG: hypothetical protein KDB11_22745, partial [Planctomycetales bacterium]|nr:hypothetical protein [Planctomycetales bacterium]